MEKVLFICVHNSARSQMAEEYLRKFAGDRFEVQSAGFEPTEINPLVIEVMQEEGIDLTGKPPQDAFELYKNGSIFNYVVTVCDDSVDKDCPIYPGMTHRLHLPFPDPSSFDGTHEEKIVKTREVREQIKKAIQEFIEWVRSGDEEKLTMAWKKIYAK